MEYPRSRRLRSANQPIIDNVLRMTPINDTQLRHANTWLQSYLNYDDDLVIVEYEGFPHEFMKSHKTEIPIGENCQAELPLYMGYRGLTTEKAYQNRKKLECLLLSVRTEDYYAFTGQLQVFQDVMGVDRNEEEMTLSLRLYRETGENGSFEEYLLANNSWLDDYLDLMMHKPAFLKKKGRKKQVNSSGQKTITRL